MRAVLAAEEPGCLFCVWFYTISTLKAVSSEQASYGAAQDLQRLRAKSRFKEACAPETNGKEGLAKPRLQRCMASESDPAPQLNPC